MDIQTPDSMSLLLTEGFHKKRVTLPDLVKVTSEMPAGHFGFGHRKGKIKEGYDADLVLVDLEKEVTLGLHRYKGHNNYSLWENKKARGVVAKTIVAGVIVAEDGEIVAPPQGRHIGCD